KDGSPHSADVSDAGPINQAPAGEEEMVTLYDCFAVATYYDGEIGPHTGTITVAMVDANTEVNLEFWHGHGGSQHKFTVTAGHFQSIRDLQKTWIETTSVDNHTHKLFIDPVDPRWRVPGAKPVQIKRKRG
ncbi:MAG: hypothetical protein RIQ81_1, partial [Pseudomonadota bacterium]